MHPPTTVRKSAFKAIDEPDIDINFGMKSIINYNDFIQDEYSKLIHPIAVKKIKEVSEGRQYINNKRQRDISYKDTAISAKRGHFSNESNYNREDGMSKLKSMYQEDASMKSYHTLISHNRKMDLTSQNEKQLSYINTNNETKTVPTKTLLDIRKEIEEKKKRNQKPFDEQSISLRTNIINDTKNEPVDKMQFLEKDSRDKVKPMDDMRKADEYRYAENNWKDKPLTFTKSTNISISPIVKNIDIKRKSICPVMQESFEIQNEICDTRENENPLTSVDYLTENKNKIPARNEDHWRNNNSNHILITKIDIPSNDKNAQTDKKDIHISNNEDISKNHFIEKPTPAIFKDEKTLFSRLAMIPDKAKKEQSLFSTGGSILNKLDVKSQKLINEVPLADGSRNNNNTRNLFFSNKALPIKGVIPSDSSRPSMTATEQTGQHLIGNFLDLSGDNRVSDTKPIPTIFGGLNSFQPMSRLGVGGESCFSFEKK